MAALGIAGSGRAVGSFAARLRAAGLAVDTFATATEVDTAPSRTRFAEGLRTLILVPRDIAESEALLFETHRLVQTAGSLSTIVLAATLSPRYVRSLRARVPVDITLIDAPFTGTLRAADEGRINFFLGGPRDAIAQLSPVFAALGRQAARMGGFGSGMAAKVMHDFLAASSNALTRIALDWAEAQGIEDERLVDLAGSTLSGLIAPGYDLIDHTASGPVGDQSVMTLVRDVELALDTALAGAHLTPPNALDDVFRNMKARALH